MIEAEQKRDPAGIGLMKRAGLDPEQYIAISDKSLYLHCMHIRTGELAIIDKDSAEIVKSPGACQGDPGQKKNIPSLL